MKRKWIALLLSAAMRRDNNILPPAAERALPEAGKRIPRRTEDRLETAGKPKAEENPQKERVPAKLRPGRIRPSGRRSPSCIPCPMNCPLRPAWRRP